jgi:hypothetical protein
MKKERIVVICICAVLLGSLYAQGIAWTCHVAMPSMAQSVWPVPFDTQFGNAEESRKTANLSDSIAAFVCSGWPPLSFLYREARLVRQGTNNLHAMKDRAQESVATEVLNRLQGMAADPSAAALRKK